jgi:hypothetical protein
MSITSLPCNYRKGPKLQVTLQHSSVIKNQNQNKNITKSNQLFDAPFWSLILPSHKQYRLDLHIISLYINRIGHYELFQSCFFPLNIICTNFILLCVSRLSFVHFCLVLYHCMKMPQLSILLVIDDGLFSVF